MMFSLFRKVGTFFSIFEIFYLKTEYLLTKNSQKMKTTIFYKFFVTANMLLMIIFLSMPVIAQQSKKEARKAKREKQEAEMNKKFILAKQLINDTTFLIPAETIQFRYGQVVTVDGTINFLKVDGKESVLQIGSDLAMKPGLNDLGGFTLKGPISNLKIKESKKMMYMSYNLTGVIGTAYIIVTITGSDKATVEVNGMFSGKAFTMYGSLVSPDSTLIYEGQEF